MTHPIFPFVVGCGRSGTTLLTAMLDSHPDLAVPAESGGMVLLFCHGLPVGGHPDRFEWPPVDRRVEPYSAAEIGAMLDELARSHRYVAWGLDRLDVIDAAFGAAVSSRVDVIRAVYATYARRQGKGRYGDKTPAHVLHIVRLAEIFPEAVFVHVIRDGRDVASSILGLPWGPTEVAGAALHWADRVTRGRRAGAILGPSRYLEVRYEDLVADPAGALGQICGHIGVTYHPAMLCHGEAARRQLTMSPAPEEDLNVVRPVTPGLRDWRNEMDAVDVATFDALVGPLLEELGYRKGDVADRQARDRAARRAEQALEMAAGQPAATW